MSALRRPIVIGNWKMHGLLAQAEKLTAALVHHAGCIPPSAAPYIALCPPFTALHAVRAALVAATGPAPIALGAQNCHAEPQGAYTGEISAPLLKDAGCTLVLLGHSERRHGMSETDAQVRLKAQAALAQGLKTVICVGETQAERESGDALSAVSSQLTASLPQGAEGEVWVAYEPVWAIGTGMHATRDDIVAMHRHIRSVLARLVPARAGGVPVLYGGSVKAGNVAEILAAEGVDGVLVGGASLDAGEFSAIIDAAAQV